jgi:hypothetical protein
MESTGMAKVAIAFTVGVGLALGGAGLYTRLTKHPPAEPVEQAAAAQPIAGGPDKLPDDDQANSSTATSTAQPAPQKAPQSTAIVAAPPAHSKPVKHRTEPVHTVVRHTAPAVLKARQSHPQAAPAPVQIAQAVPDPHTSGPNPYTSSPYPNVQPAPPSAPEAPLALPATQPAPESTPQPAPQPRQPRTLTIPAGTRLTIRLNQGLSSDHSFVGDVFQATLESQIIVSDALIADRGSKVVGKVVSVQRSTHGDSPSDLTVTLTLINTIDGQRVAIQTSNYDQQTKRNTQRDAEKIGGGAAIGAIIGAIAGGSKGAAIGAGVGGAAGGGDVLLTKGRPAVLESEAEISFRTTAPLTITERLNNN